MSGRRRLRHESERPDPLRLRSPVDLVVAVPYLIGFEPEASLVVLVHDTRTHRLVLSLRLDLPAPGTPPHELVRLGHDLADLVHRAAGDTVQLLTYPGAADLAEAGDPTRPHEAVVAEVGAVLAGRGVRIGDALCVRTAPDGTRSYRSYLCSDPACCPPQGRVVGPGDGLDVRATFVGSGVAVRPSRAELVASLSALDAGAPGVAVLRAAVDAARADRARARTPTERRRRRGQAARRLDDALAAAASEVPQADLPVELLAELVAVVEAEVQVRDVLLGEATRAGRLDSLVTVLTPAVRGLTGAPLAAAAATVAAAAYLDGAGALAWVAVDRALGADPAQSLAGLVAGALRQALPPAGLREVVCELPSPRDWNGVAVPAPTAGPARRTGRAAAGRARPPGRRRAG